MEKGWDKEVVVGREREGRIEGKGVYMKGEAKGEIGWAVKDMREKQEEERGLEPAAL